MAQTTMRISLKNERQRNFFTAVQTLSENAQPFEDWIKENETIELTFPSKHAYREAIMAFRAQFPRQRHNVNSRTSVIKGPLGTMPLPCDRSPWE